jgi:hypothetical protein
MEASLGGLQAAVDIGKVVGHTPKVSERMRHTWCLYSKSNLFQILSCKDSLIIAIKTKDYIQIYNVLRLVILYKPFNFT